MASSVTKEVEVGTYGIWRMVISQTSQSQANWTSTIRVRLYMKNTGPGGSYNNDGASMSINGPGSHDWSDSSVPFNVAGGATDLVADRSFTIDHNASGALSATFTATLGATGTSTFGSGGSVTGTIVADNLATVPGKPGTPVLVTNDDMSPVLKFADNADNGGLAVTARRLYYNTSNTTTGALYVTVTGSNVNTAVPGLNPKSDYWFWGRTMNAEGWSAYSSVLPVKTLAKPEPPTQPAITNITQTTIGYSFTDGADNGSPITARQLAYSPTETDEKTVIGSAASGTATGLPPGTPLYIWARTQNGVDWSDWSLYRYIRTVAGFYVWISGVKVECVPYERSGGAWILLEPNTRVNEVWKPATR